MIVANAGGSQGFPGSLRVQEAEGCQNGEAEAGGSQARSCSPGAQTLGQNICCPMPVPAAEVCPPLFQGVQQHAMPAWGLWRFSCDAILFTVDGFIKHLTSRQALENSEFM